MIQTKPDQQQSQQIPQTLQYTITNSQALCGQGNINCIKTGDGYWRSYIGTDATKLKLQLKNSCTLNSVQFKINNTMMVQFNGYYNGEEVFNQMKCLNSKQRQAGDVVKYFFKCLNGKIDQIQVDLHSFNKKQVLISYLKLNGNIVGGRKRASIKKNVQIFQQRNKQAPIKRTRKQQLQKTDKKNFQQKKQKLQKIKEQQSKQSQRPTNKTQKAKSQLQLEMPQYFKQDQLMEPQQCEIEQDYKTIQVTEEQLQIFKQVNQKWVESQRKMQANFGVKMEHKLSIKLNPKCLNGLKFCLTNIYGQQKSKYIKMIKQLGGLVRQQACEGCIVATSHPKGNIVGIARLMNDTHIVKLNYIDQCYRQKIKIKFNKFQFSPQEFFM